MRTWRRALYDVKCGGCGTMIQAGEPVAVLESRDGSWRKYRCAECAGEPVPNLEPVRTEHRVDRIAATQHATFARFTGQGALGFDREPGEEG